MTTPLDGLPVAVILWVAVYAADYYLTLYGRRLWMRHAQPFIKLSGSYELNPYYQKDVDTENKVSRRFILMLLFGVVWMALMYVCCLYLKLQQVFPAAVGYLVLPEVVILSTHVQNIRLFKAAGTEGAVEGSIGYARWVSMDQTAWKFGYWATVFLGIGLLGNQWFFMGGMISSFWTCFRYGQYSRKSLTQTTPIARPSSEN